ncbi:MAG: ABC transporter ATP-binding protein/permease [Acidobacteria bacterium]|nr:ABC transporter ATP-binding protein/permease [Acidobacteriota bacterium]
MRHFLRVLWVARRHAAWVLLVIVSMAMVACATVFALNLIRPIYDNLLSPGGASRAVSAAATPKPFLVSRLDAVSAQAQAWIQARLGTGRSTLLLLVLVAIVAKNVFTFLARYSVAQLGLATVRDLRDLVFDAVLRQSPRYFHDVSSGVLMSRVVNDVRLVQEALAERFGDLLQSSVTLIGILAYLFSLNLHLSLVVLLLAPLLLAPVVHFARRLRRRSWQSQERMGDLTTVLDEAVHGMKVIQAFGMERFEAERFRNATQRHFWANLRARAIQIANAPVMEIVGAVGALALIGYASSRIASGAMTIGDFSAFLLGLWAAYAPVKNLNQFNLALQQAVVASERIFQVIDEPVDILDLPGAVVLQGVGDGVELEGVWFAYEDDAWVLSDLRMAIPTGRTVALVGPSGAGKSTVAQLIPRFWDVQRGAVRVGGRDVRESTLASLRGLIGLVTQETILFNDTVRANIAFGRDNPSQDRIEAAARAAFAHDFILQLPKGYDTVIGESGLSLSGGQRQRLAIARALFKDPPILILDEATSSLDAESERLVQEALENLMKGRTTLVIAHRLSTVRNANEILVLHEGRIVERGTFRNLLEADGVFAHLVSMHELAGGDDAPPPVPEESEERSGS